MENLTNKQINLVKMCIEQQILKNKSREVGRSITEKLEEILKQISE